MELIYILLILLLFARVFGEISVWLGQPALVGELVAGITIGSVASYHSSSLPILSSLTQNDTFLAIADLGVFFLMLLGGVELKAKKITNASKPAIIVAAFGMVVPLVAGYGIGYWLFPESEYKTAQCLFTGTALAITAVPVTIRVLMDLGKLESKVGGLIVSAAIIDDILSLILLAILTAFIANGTAPSFDQIVMLLGKVFTFFTICAIFGVFVFPRFRLLTKLKSAEFEFTCLLIVALGLAFLAEALHLHFIIGAFMAGLFFGREAAGNHTYDDIKEKLNAITKGFLAPIFFVSIGLHLDLSAFTQIPFFVAIMLSVAIFAKLLGAGIPARFVGYDATNSAAVGIAMSGRGAVELIIADIALRAGLFSKPSPAPPEIKYLFSTIVIVAVVTTILSPIGLKWVYRKERIEESRT